MNKYIKKGFFVIAVLSMMLMTVFAEGADSAEKNVTVYGYDYRYWSCIANNVSGRVFAQTTVCLDDNIDSVPIGYLGGQARLYSSSGVLKKSSEWEYNEYSQYAGISKILCNRTKR